MMLRPAFDTRYGMELSAKKLIPVQFRKGTVQDMVVLHRVEFETRKEFRGHTPYDTQMSRSNLQ